MRSCSAGSEILNSDQCKEACTTLGISVSKSFKNGKPCLKGGNGMCKQSRNIGPSANMVCKHSGITIRITHESMLFSCSFICVNSYNYNSFFSCAAEADTTLMTSEPTTPTSTTESGALIIVHSTYHHLIILSSLANLQICSYNILGLPYTIEAQGESSCQKGTVIMTASQCKTACNQLEKEVGLLRTGKVCYIAGNGKCRQDGRKGSKTSLVCYTGGKMDTLHNHICIQNKNIKLSMSEAIIYHTLMLSGALLRRKRGRIVRTWFHDYG